MVIQDSISTRALQAGNQPPDSPGLGRSASWLSLVGQSRRLRDLRDESGLPPTPDGLRHRSEPTLSGRSSHFEANEVHGGGAFSRPKERGFEI
jgi:hypothetical protein